MVLNKPAHWAIITTHVCLCTPQVVNITEDLQRAAENIANISTYIEVKQEALAAPCNPFYLSD